jgi:signal transduction histidine kinase
VDEGYHSQGAARDEVLYRIAQEALHNVAKHARATRAEVRLDGCEDRVRLRVADDGVGFSLDERGRAHSGEETGGLGLRSMRERAVAAGGTLHVTRGPVRGTVVEARLPLARGVAP